MPAPSESLVALERQLAAALVRFETLDTAWPKGRTALERAEIGRRREEALSEIMVLRHRIATGRAETLADAAVAPPRFKISNNLSYSVNHLLGISAELVI